MKIGMTSVFVNDPMKAFTFYTEVLGFEKRMLVPEHNLAIVVSPEDRDGIGLLLEPNQNPVAAAYQKGVYDAGMPCIVFGTEDIQADYEKLKTKGVVFRRPPSKNEWGIDTIFEDTFGNLILLHQQL